jgi:hypothetical protein
MKPTIQKPTTDSVRIIKSARCATLSTKSELQYDIGCTDESEVQIRIVRNSGSGSHSRDWVALQAIESTLAKAPRGKSITSNVLGPLFRGKSINNQLFLFAVLVDLGLVLRSDGEKRGYEIAESGEFAKRTQALIAGKGTSAGADGKSKKARAKVATLSKGPSVSRKK